MLIPVIIMEVLDQVKEYADKAHGDQMRLYEEVRYIVHPVRVMELCKEYTDDITILAAALLHDVLEDTEKTEDDLRQFLGGLMTEQQAETTLGLVVELTDVFIKDDYPKWNRRKRKQNEAKRISETSAASQTVKYADIIDNCSEIAKHWEDDFSAQLLKECRSLLSKIDKGNPELYKRAIITVDEGLVQLEEQKRLHEDAGGN